MEHTSPDSIGSLEEDPIRSRLAQWVLLTGDRRTVAASFTAAIFLAVALLAAAGVVGLSAPRMMWFLNGTINGLLTLIPITVGINQIILSRELNPLGEFSSEFEDTMEFRRQVEELTGETVSSAQASAFCASLFVALERQAQAFDNACAASDDPELEREASDYAQSVKRRGDQMTNTLDSIAYGLLDTFLALLDFQDTDLVQRTHYFRNEYDEALPEEAISSLRRIMDVLERVNTIREYLMTLAIQRELADLSATLLYTGFLAIVVAGLVILGYRNVPAFTLSNAAGTVLAAAVFAVALIPLAVLISHMLRVATIARRSAAFGPFLTPEQHRRSRGQQRSE